MALQHAEIHPVPRNSQSLLEAGRAAYEAARKAHMPVAHIAEQSHQPASWFARSMAQIVGVEAHVPGEAGYRHVVASGDLVLSDDLASLASAQQRYDDLRLSKADIDKYLNWARTVY